MNKKNIFICCTEQSGDNICYNIIKNLNIENINIEGVCGKRSERFFKNKFFDISDFKSIGLIEILFSLKKYINMINKLKYKIISKNYDLVICIDSPDFNYNLVKSLRKKGFNNYIIQIVAPTVWAWRKGRAKKFANFYNEIFLLFEFEKKFFKFPNLKSTFIGHPIFHIKKRLQKNSYKYISFLFGSRDNEINKLFTYFDFLENYISSNNLKWKIFIPTLPHLKDKIENLTSNWKTEVLLSTDIDNFDNFYDDVFISVTCSGTASLEIAKRNIPQIVIYKLNIFTELILKIFVKVKNACLLNIVSKNIIIPEVVNSNLTKKNLLYNFTKILNNSDIREKQIENINVYMKNLQSKKSPYKISAERILSLI